MNIMTEYNGYTNRQTWEIMLYINSISDDAISIYKTVYNMILENINKNIICTYIYSQLETDIKEHGLPIDLNKISINEIIEHIYLDVVTNNKIYN